MLDSPPLPAGVIACSSSSTRAFSESINRAFQAFVTYYDRVDLESNTLSAACGRCAEHAGASANQLRYQLLPQSWPAVTRSRDLARQCGQRYYGCISAGWSPHLPRQTAV